MLDKESVIGYNKHYGGTNMQKELLRTPDIAELLGYTVDYVRKLANAKRIPAVKSPGKRGRWFFRRQRILDWVDAGMPNQEEQPSLFE